MESYAERERAYAIFHARMGCMTHKAGLSTFFPQLQVQRVWATMRRKVDVSSHKLLIRPRLDSIFACACIVKLRATGKESTVKRWEWGGEGEGEGERVSTNQSQDTGMPLFASS